MISTPPRPLLPQEQGWVGEGFLQQWPEGKQRFQGLGHGFNNFGQSCLIPHIYPAVSAVLPFFQMGSLKKQNLDNNLCRRKVFKVYVKKHRLAGGGKSYPSPALNFLSPVHHLYFLHCLIYIQSFSQTQFFNPDLRGLTGKTLLGELKLERVRGRQEANIFSGR